MGSREMHSFVNIDSPIFIVLNLPFSAQ